MGRTIHGRIGIWITIGDIGDNVMTRQINDAGLQLIKDSEGLKLEPYQDIKGIWTIGYGSTRTVNASTLPITQEQAEAFLLSDIEDAEQAIEDNINVVLTDNQFGALTSLVYNCGVAPLKGHLGQFLNADNYERAADAFLQWDHCNGVVVNGLLERRQKERDLFLTSN